MTRIIRTFLTILQAVLATLVGYLMLLTVAAFRAKQQTPAARASKPHHRFLILIPAHNEEKLLPVLLKNLTMLNYPRNCYQVHVVADNCEDKTAVIAQQHGATVHERFHDTLRGKGYALQWLLQRIWQQNIQHDAIVILDADSIVSDNFLQVMDARMASGERAIQAYYAVRNPGDSGTAGLRYAALAVLHYLRPQGRMVLGGSAGLKGNGMVFAADLLQSHEWSASLTEDIEYHMRLILDGERVTFAPDAVVWAEMPDTYADSDTQNQRWEQGRMEMIRSFVPTLLQKAWQKRSFLLFDAAMEQIIPPFSVLAGLSLVTALGAVALPDGQKRMTEKRGVKLGTAVILGQLIYLLAGLKMANAPRQVYRSLLGIPRFIVWKLWLYVRVLFGRGQEGWVRTKRNEDS